MSYLTDAWPNLTVTPLISTPDSASATSSTRLIPVSDMIMHNPTPANVPSTWSAAMLPPGLPIAPIMSERDREIAEAEPRSYQYYPSFNSNLTPRIYLGLMPFSMLKWYSETIPEAALFRRLRIAALTDFVPQIVGPDGEVVQKARVVYERDRRGRPLRNSDGTLRKAFTGDNEIEKFPELGWMTTCPEPSIRKPIEVIKKYIATYPDGTSDKTQWLTKASDEQPQYNDVPSEIVSDIRWLVGRPDRYNAFPSWLSRFLANYVHYNAPALYRIRDKDNRIVGLRVIDGSTIFAMIDVRGETPAPPAPAYSSIIWGTPRQWFNTYQLWYRPTPLRPDSPYGYTSVEDGKYYLDFLYEYWQWWLATYNRKVLPSGFFETPPGTVPDKAYEYVRELQARRQGNYAEQQVPEPMPGGWKFTDVKKEEMKGEEYIAVVKMAGLMYGVHPSEIGIVSGATGLTGSKGTSEKGEEAHARIGTIPDKNFVEMPFNDVLLEKADQDPKYRGLTFVLAPPDVGIDPRYEDTKWDQVWQLDGMRLNEYRDKKGLEDAEGDKGEMYYSELSGKKPPVAPAAAPVDENGKNGNAPLEVEADQADAGEDVEPEKIMKYEDIQHDDDGGMVALFIPGEAANRLRSIIQSIDLPPEARLETADNLHVTLAFLPDDLAQKSESRILAAMQVAALSVQYKTLDGHIGGYGVFVNGDEQVIYASLDAPELPALRQALCEQLEANEIEYAKDHGFTPHITLAYLPADYSFVGIDVPPIDVEIDGLTLAIGEAEKITITFYEGFTRIGKRYTARSNVVLDDYIGFEKAWHITALQKHCGICPDDDDYFGAPLSRDTTILFPQQGANETEIVAMSPAGRESRPALWKPEGGEDEVLIEALGHPQYQSEAAAYLLDRTLRFYLVPLAYVGDVDGERGAAIMYVRGNEPRRDVSAYAPAWVEKSAILDYILNQPDRATHNYLTHPDDDARPILIDHGLTFGVRNNIVRSVFVEAWRGNAISDDLIAELQRCLGCLEWRDIAELVGDEATDLAKARVQTLLDEGMIPTMEGVT